MKKRYLQPAAELIRCENDVILASVLGADNVGEWNEDWLIRGQWEEIR